MNNQIITKYERTRIIGTRAEQLARGAEPKTDFGDLTDPVLIAMKEYNEGVIPLNIRRRLPNGKTILVQICKK